MKKLEGLNLFELLVMLAVVLVMLALFISITFNANFWYTHASVLEALQADDQTVTRVVKSERNIVHDSIITVEHRDGSRSMICLDTSILWNHRFVPCGK